MSFSSDFEFDVFLSYSSKDGSRVLHLAERLREKGVRVWLDKWEIKPGDNIVLAIERGLDASRMLTAFSSKDSYSVFKTKLYC